MKTCLVPGPSHYETLLICCLHEVCSRTKNKEICKSLGFDETMLEPWPSHGSFLPDEGMLRTSALAGGSAVALAGIPLQSCTLQYLWNCH